LNGWVETRLYASEQRLEYLLRLVQDLQDQVKAAQQTARNAFSQPGQLGNSALGVYICFPTTMGGATGSFGALTPGSQSGLTVYQVSGTTQTSLGTFTVYNWLPASPVASKVAYCLPDGAGNFVLIDQSCT
jgi:hypothetical protein